MAPGPRAGCSTIGRQMESGLITAIDPADGGSAITYNGWTIFIPAEELNGFCPVIGDEVQTGPSLGRPVQYISIAGRVIRNISDDEQAAKHAEMIADFRRKKVEEFAAHGDEWKATAKALYPVLRKRIERFEAESGDEFWIDMGSYELYAIKAADVLARHVMTVYPGKPAKQIEWIEWWDSLNSKKYNYDYKHQMEILPEFGDGHSGNTHGAAVYYAKRAVRNEPC